MQFVPIKTPVLTEGDHLATILLASGEIQDGDIIAVSSKAIATVEGAAIDLQKVEVTEEGKQWAEKCGRTPEFRQAVLNEARRMNGDVISGCSVATLTEVSPDGMEKGSILVANAGLDESNIEEGLAIGWPLDSVGSLVSLKEALEAALDSRLGLLMTDSCCRPRRVGLTAIALTVAGFDPLTSFKGAKDLFGRTLKITEEATADQLATAANMLMGNADASVPAVIIRDHSVQLSEFAGWVPGIAREEDLFFGAL